MIGIGARYKETVVAFFPGNLYLVDDEVAATIDLQEPAIAFVAKESLVPRRSCSAQRGEDDCAFVGILWRSSSLRRTM
jgi:hypothetical protein